MRILKSIQAGLRLFFSIALLLAAGSIPSAAAQELPPPVADALKRVGIPAEAVGVFVQEVGPGAILTAANATIPMNPASTMKLVTTDAALELLGPAFTWKTQAYAAGQQLGDVLHGDLIIKGSGDPKLVMENFWLFLRQIRARGIREIRGDVVLDRSLFEEGPYDPAAFDGDPFKSYNAGPDALLLNYKSFAFHFFPDEVNGQVRIALDPPLAGYKVAVPRLSHEDCGDWRSKLQATFNGADTVFAGVYPASCGDRTWYMHPYQMTSAQYFGSVFSRVWNDLGGIFVGQVRNGTLPSGARLVGEWESPAVSEVIRDINKYSNNVMARQLLLAIAAEVYKTPANPQRGAQAIRNWLAGKAIAAPDLVIENGSGLSRNERISAVTMVRMLLAAYRSPSMPEFISSMPLAGQDGTMRRRLNGHGVSGSAHIKTGSLNDVRAIAGYVLAASGKRYALSCIVNHPNAAAAQEALDLLLQWVYERG